jgi:hypothetical protein
MLNNLKISTKLKLNSLVVVLGLIILAIITFNSISNLEKQYIKESSIKEKISNYKSVLIGGLLINSSLNVFKNNTNDMKPLKIGKI